VLRFISKFQEVGAGAFGFGWTKLATTWNLLTPRRAREWSGMQRGKKIMLSNALIIRTHTIHVISRIVLSSHLIRFSGGANLAVVTYFTVPYSFDKLHYYSSTVPQSSPHLTLSASSFKQYLFVSQTLAHLPLL